MGNRAVLLLMPRRRPRLTNFGNFLFSKSVQEKVAGDIRDRSLSQRRLRYVMIVSRKDTFLAWCSNLMPRVSG